MRLAVPGHRRLLQAAVVALILLSCCPAGAQGRREIDALQNQITQLYDEGRLREATRLAKRALALALQQPRRDAVTVARCLNSLALMYEGQGDYANAEPLYKQSLTLVETALGDNHVIVGTVLNNLAEVYRQQGRGAEAEPLYLRSVKIGIRNFAKEPASLGVSLSNLGLLYEEQRRFKEAQPRFEQTLQIYEKVHGPDHPLVATALNNLAGVFESQREYSKAEPLYQRALDLRTKLLGSDHPDVATSLNNLAALYDSQNRLDEAEALYLGSLAIRQKVMEPDHPSVFATLNNLAVMYVKKRDWTQAAKFWKEATDGIKRRVGSGVTGMQEGSAKGESAHLGWQFEGLLKVTYRMTEQNDRAQQKLASEMFELAQWGQGSDAGAAITLMAARASEGDATLAALERERQDLIEERQIKFAQLMAAKQEEKRDQRNERELINRSAAIDARLSAISGELATRHPKYAALSTFKAMSVAEVQAVLRTDETLLLLLGTGDHLEPLPEETFVWVITKTDVRWVRSEVGSKSLEREVSALRCGLDTSAWFTEQSKCKELTGVDYTEDDQNAGVAPPFDASRAHRLYEALFGKVGDLIRGKHLLVVSAGALGQLPFHVLVTTKPAPGVSIDMRRVAWLASSNAITVLPATSSLLALRQNVRASAGSEPFIGFGNPVLNGTQCGQVIIPDKCPNEEMMAVNADAQSRSIRRAAKISTYFREGLADVAALKGLCPLPDTAHELKCVARSLGADQSSTFLGGDMTEAAIKKASLFRYRIIHFATHGLLAGEMATLSKARAEPALVMTPPKVATEEDDGLLTASEIAKLKLDADWVVMSACNTAAGGTRNADALSGLARAFFYAGARALLVSHWPVNSYAATQLTSRTFSELQKNATMGRSEAFRRAMLALIDDKQRPWAAHPSVWAPFVVVGEGASAK